MSAETVDKVVYAIARSRLDCVLAGTSELQFSKLERGQFELSLVITGMITYSRDRMTPILAKLHWLPILARVSFTITTMVFKLRQTKQSSFPPELIEHAVPSGHCGQLRVVKAHRMSQKTVLVLVLELSVTLQPRRGTLCQTVSG